MRKSRTLLGAALTLALITAAGTAAAESIEAQVYEKQVITHHSRGGELIADTKATLLTTPAGAFVSLDTRELIPGNAYTLWFVVINKPEACEKSPCRPPDILEATEQTQSDIGYAGGLVARADGSGRFATYQPVGALAQAWFGKGYQNARRAEIHLVINDHGPLLADMVQTMLGSYRGGCTDKSLPPPFPASAKSDGTPGPNKCALYQVVVFQQ